MDGSFVETTSQVAANALAKWYGEQGGEEYKVTGRLVGDRMVYRIRPRSRPSSPQPSPSLSAPPPSSSSDETPFAKGSWQPNRALAPSLAVTNATPQKKTLRLSRSIPLLRSPREASPPPPPPSLQHLDLPSTSQKAAQRISPLRKAGSTPSLSSSLHSSTSLSQSHPPRTTSNPTTGSGTQGDVLGRLLGWNYPASMPPPLSSAASSSGVKRGREEAVGTARVRKLDLGLGETPEVGEDDRADLPDDLDELDAIPSPTDDTEELCSPPPTSIPHNPRTPSPFGTGVRIHGISRPSLSPLPSPGPRREMREVASSDSIRTARAEPIDPPRKKRRFDDPRIFDLFQGVEAGGVSRHSRMPSVASSSDIQVVEGGMGGEDPRFVLWGYKEGTPSSVNLGRRTSVVDEGIAMGSPATSASGSPAASSQRWSLNNRRSSIPGGSPASSIRDSVSSAGLVPSRVLMAATVERLVAELTAKIEVELLASFFLTYRSFVRPIDLLRLLICRFEWAMEEPKDQQDDEERRIVRVRTFVVLRHWLLNHFADDFVPDRQLRTALVTWLNKSGKEERFRSNPKEARLIKGLKKLARVVKERHVNNALGAAGTGAGLGSGLGMGMSTTTIPIIHKEPSDEDVDLDLALDSYPVSSTTAASGSSRMPIPFFHSKERDFTDPTPHLSTPAASFPLPNSQNVVARSFTSALGTIGRFKRMLGNRASHAGPLAASSSTGTSGAVAGIFDELEFERTDTGDLLWVRTGLERYLEFHNIPTVVEGEEGAGGGHVAEIEDAETTPALTMGSTSTAEDEEDQEEEREGAPTPLLSDGAGLGIDHGGIAHSASAHTFKLEDNAVDIASSAPPPVAYLDNFHPGTFYGGRPQSGRIELDDIDLSDEDEDVVEVKKTLKRLPGGHNLRTLKALAPAAPPSQLFRDSVSSYGSPRRPSYGGPERESVMFVDDEEDVPPGVTIIPYFISDGIDSDDDEPGDVEAALRRLEGLVDDTKEKEKARKVQRQMEKSEQLKLSKSTVASSDDDGSRDSQSVTRPSTRASTVSSHAQSVASSPTASQAAPVPFAPLEATTTRDVGVVAPVSVIPPRSQPSSPTNPRHARTFSRLATKPSVSKIFANSLPRPASARPGIAPPTHRSFILLCRTEILAQQFCLIERDMFRLLSWQELVGGSWVDPTNRPGETLDWEAYLKNERRAKVAAKEKGEPMPSTVQAMIARYNLTSNWVASEVVLTFNPDERVALIAKFIRLAFKCYCQSNFQTLTQIIHGLSCPEVERLKKTWARVPKWEMRKYYGMKTFVAPDRNFKHLREVTAALLSEYGPAGQRAAPQEPARGSASKGAKSPPAAVGCLPFLGLFLKDLAMTAELPTYLDPSSTGTPADVDAVGSLQCLTDPDAFAHLPPLPEGVQIQALVNVHKTRLVSSTIQQLLAFQELAADYGYTNTPSLYMKALKIRCLDSKTIEELSLRLAAQP
ncbi:guanine nucleotide exchange factor LTE1 [Pseudohyphozyma bogoriensis]|nr:guanine nucleotide exchange factor LTE1 [Pseudohyphozyma bogoriensis]